jgi:arsenate reductase (glutaredoxin)
MSVTIFHNPRCSKSRQSLELLIKQGIKPVINEYLTTPPSAEKIKEILRKLGYAPRDLMRKKEDAYTEHNLDNQTLSDDYLIDFMIKHPILIERPIVLANEKAAIGRPPKKVLEIL